MAENKDNGLHLGNVRKSSTESIAMFLTWCNLLNAALLITCGVLAFIDFMDVSAAFAGVYLILFGILLCCFEVHFKSFDRMIFMNFGFMFYLPGRMLFFFFCGTLCFCMGVFGYVVGAATGVNMVFTIFVMRVHPGYAKSLAQKNIKYHDAAQSAEKNNLANEDGNGGFGGVVGSASRMADGDASLQDMKNVAKFANENKETIKKGAEFYGENKEAVDKGVKLAAKHDAFV